MAIVVKLVVTSKSKKGSNSNSIREEDLCSSICKEIFIYNSQVKALLTNPNLSLVKPLPLWSEQELKTFRSTFQCKSFDTEDGENDVGEDSTDPE